MFIFVLLSSEDGFKTKWEEKGGVLRAPALYNGAFSTLAFIIGALTSILSGFLGMKIATYANARTALEARKDIAPAFMVGKYRVTSCSTHLGCCSQGFEQLTVPMSLLPVDTGFQ